MSEHSNTFPFPGMEAGEDLDISAIFGNSTPDSDVNPFDMPAAQSPIVMTPPAAADAPAQPAPDPMPEPVPEVEPAPVAPPQAPTPTQPDPAPAPAPASPEPAAEEDANPIAAAFAQQTEKNTRQGLLERPPVFCYKNAKDPIEDDTMTFEELRIRKSEDFTELEEGKSVSWSVEYCGIRKDVKDPKGTTIFSMKESIERSKEFLDALRRSKGKTTDCLVKPKVTMKAKGVAAYKGIFGTIEEARASDKVICVIPSGDGKFYEMQKMAQGEFIAPKNKVVEFQQIRAGFTPALPLIPLSLIGQIIAFFRSLMTEEQEYEALVLIYWDNVAREYFAYVPKQTIGRETVDADLSECPYDDDPRYIRYADIHSHNSMDAYFSPTDDWDERETGLYLVVGHLENFFPDMEARISCGGSFVPIDAGEVIEGLEGSRAYPAEWAQNVTRKQMASAALARLGQTLRGRP